jgi:hypothetical protein
MSKTPTFERAEKRKDFWLTWGLGLVFLGWFLGLSPLFFLAGAVDPALAAVQIVGSLLLPGLAVVLMQELRFRQFAAAELSETLLDMQESEGA